MKMIISTTIALLLAATVFAQKPACDCPDCREKAAAEAAGKIFTLPGLEGLNEPLVHEETQVGKHDDHDHSAESTGHEGCDHAEEEHTSHAGHDHGDHAAEGIELSDEIRAKIGVRLQVAEGGTIASSSVFPAEIKLNRNRTAAISPRYPSIVRQVFAEIGDAVRKGDVLASLENRETMAVYSVSSPRAGVIISKDAAVGETASEDRILYEVADLSSVWADISIFPKYQHLIHKGMTVELIAHDGHTAQGTVQHISPLVSHETRTFTARCVLEGAREDFTPGAFVRARIVVEKDDVDVAVQVDAVQMLDGHPVVFVPDDHGFQTVEVRTGLSDGSLIQILSGLKPGDEYVAEGAFALKAQMVTSGMDPHAGHGH
jgi:cobalt-zinc-cadmium efflux system membrane fusion protein